MLDTLSSKTVYGAVCVKPSASWEEFFRVWCGSRAPVAPYGASPGEGNLIFSGIRNDHIQQLSTLFIIWVMSHVEMSVLSGRSTKENCKIYSNPQISRCLLSLIWPHFSKKQLRTCTFSTMLVLWAVLLDMVDVWFRSWKEIRCFWIDRPTNVLLQTSYFEWIHDKCFSSKSLAQNQANYKFLNKPWPRLLHIKRVQQGLINHEPLIQISLRPLKMEQAPEGSTISLSGLELHDTKAGFTQNYWIIRFTAFWGSRGPIQLSKYLHFRGLNGANYLEFVFLTQGPVW